jgi:hypothetical protein
VRWLASAHARDLRAPPPPPWTTPDLTDAGLIQVDLKTDGVHGDAALRAQRLEEHSFEEAWLELGRRALTSGRWAEARFCAQVLRAVSPAIYTSGKLWLAGVACYFTGHFREGTLPPPPLLLLGSSGCRCCVVLCLVGAKRQPRPRPLIMPPRPFPKHIELVLTKHVSLVQVLHSSTRRWQPTPSTPRSFSGGSCARWRQLAAAAAAAAAQRRVWGAGWRHAWRSPTLAQSSTASWITLMAGWSAPVC